jgi:acetyl esterase/lipase
MSEVTRRAVSTALGATMLASPALAQSEGGAPPEAGLEVMPLWPFGPPGAPPTAPVEQSVRRGPGSGWDRALSGIATPRVTIVRPDRPNGAALLIIPGGAYVRETFDKEGLEVAHRAATGGVTGVVLTYRLPTDGWAAGADAPLRDAQRAMRLIRAHAHRLNIDPNRVGVLGFSAGGHLAASLATRSAVENLEQADEIGRLSALPDFAGLLYPVITMAGANVHAHSRDALLGPNPSAEALTRCSAELSVTADTPPTFIALAADDPVVSVENSLVMFAALRRWKIPAELHVFEHGGHGFGLTLPASNTAAAWPDLMTRWLGMHQFL